MESLNKIEKKNRKLVGMVNELIKYFFEKLNIYVLHTRNNNLNFKEEIEGSEN